MSSMVCQNKLECLPWNVSILSSLGKALIKCLTSLYRLIWDKHTSLSDLTIRIKERCFITLRPETILLETFSVTDGEAK